MLADYYKMPSRCKGKNGLCGKRPTYGYPLDYIGDINPMYEKGKKIMCTSCKLDGMEDIETKKCEHNGCKTIATSGYEYKVPLYCAAHKMPDMINVLLPKCTECDKPAYYGINFASYCSNHIPNGIKYKTFGKVICDGDECNEVAYYGYEGKPPRKCILHKEYGMIPTYKTSNRTQSKTLCKFENCTSRALYGDVRGSLERCRIHKGADMIVLNRAHMTPEQCEEFINSRPPVIKNRLRRLDILKSGFI